MRAKADQLKQEKATLAKKELDLLKKSIPATPETSTTKELSSAEALRILSTFESTERKISGALGKDVDQVIRGNSPKADGQIQPSINKLEQLEVAHRNSVREIESERANVGAAEKSVEQALNAEQLAIKRLEEAQKALADARDNIQLKKKEQSQAQQRLKTATEATDRAGRSVNQHREKVRIGLKLAQRQTLEREALYLQYESDRLNDVANDLQKQRTELEKKLQQELRKESLLRGQQQDRSGQRPTVEAPKQSDLPKSTTEPVDRIEKKVEPRETKLEVTEFKRESAHVEAKNGSGEKSTEKNLQSADDSTTQKETNSKNRGLFYF